MASSFTLFRKLDCQFLDDEFSSYILFAIVISSWEKPGGSEVQSRHLSQQDNRHFSRTNRLFALSGGTPRRQSGKQLCNRLLRSERSEDLHFFNAALDRGYAKFGFLLLKYIFKLAKWTEIWLSWS